MVKFFRKRYNLPMKLARKIFKVSQINTAARIMLEANFASILIEGEISNLVQPSSGHMYFSLKDASAQVKAAMFRHQQFSLKFRPKNGLQVVVTAQVSLYEPRGDYQLIIEHMELAGDGLLHAKFIQLKTKLEAAGLFALEHQQPIPKTPRCIGVITSATGAAIRDILQVLKRRQPNVAIIIYPTQVQGEAAAGQIVNALQLANQRNECDTLILARGGGSLEDLWPFNEEIVAHAIFASQIPIISAIGHEIDFTIADFVADLRAPTPSAAAELAVPDILENLKLFQKYQQELFRLINYKLQQSKWRLQNLISLLHHPSYYITKQTQKLDYLEACLYKVMQQKLTSCEQRFATAAQGLELISPLATLLRGYAIVTQDSHVVSSINAVTVGDHIQIKLADGILNSLIV
jgi:exodeoxyribonuclease VII large subunit